MSRNIVKFMNCFATADASSERSKIKRDTDKQFLGFYAVEVFGESSLFSS